MGNLIYNRETTTLPPYEKITHRNGDVIGIKVRRPTYTVHYHRTDRSAAEVFEAAASGMKKLFLNVDGFAKYAGRRRVLDLGCGGGSLVRDLQKHSVSINGLDLHLNETQQRSPFFVQGDAFSMPFANASYDIILSFWSLFHYEPIAQIGSLMREAHRVLKPGGTIWIPALNEMERIYQVKVCCKRLNMSANIHLPAGVIEVVKR